MTIPQNNSMTGNIRGQHARYECNSHGNIISNPSQQHDLANGVTSHLDDHIPNLSSRFVGNGRQSSLSQASGGVTVSEGNVFDKLFLLSVDFIIAKALSSIFVIFQNL